MKKSLFLIVFLIFAVSFGQESSFSQTEISVNKIIDGTLLVPNEGSKTLAIIIAGSGPTDRDGNQNFLKSNNLKKLAENLTKNGISTFRYDKRTVKQIRTGRIDPKTMFDDFVKDASDIIDYFKKDSRFEKIYIIGHSKGSLVGMIAGKDKIDGFVSLAGAGQPIDEVITEQVTRTAPMFTEDTKRVFGILKEGNTTDDFPVALGSIFNKQIQPFMMSWMKYNPQDEIAKLDIPVLIINGTKDLQVSVAEAELLHKASPTSELKIIKKMNHVLFTIEGDDLENSKSYNEAFRQINEVLISTIVKFMNN
uniref:alpha/beta hydrolase n=1 Tax=Gelidibacter sp. TaxID=2018083 RepID=UPI00404A3622